jgi:hypothetical protein
MYPIPQDDIPPANPSKEMTYSSQEEKPPITPKEMNTPPDPLPQRDASFLPRDDKRD